MFEIDMSKEPESKLLFGINLWRVASSKIAKTQAGDSKLQIKFKCGEIEFIDGLTLSEKAWFYTRPKLIALGISPTFKGSPDDLPGEITGKSVWIATSRREYETLDRSPGSAGRMVKRVGMQVDSAALESQGYQHESRPPAGVAVTGMGAEDETPF